MENIEANKMYIRIKPNAYVWADSNKLREYLKENEGKLIEVETEHLFTNQYNTHTFRLFDAHISEVLNDARIGRGKCKYCGKMLTEGQVCDKYTDTHPHVCGNTTSTCAQYGIEWFTPKNTFFLKYPQGIKPIQSETSNASAPKIKLGSYYLEAYPSLDYMRLQNCRQTINFKFADGKYYTHNGIGWTERKYLPIPSSIWDKVKKAVIKLSNQTTEA